MKLEIDKDILLQGLGRTQGVVERRAHTPILSHCLLEARADQLIIAATDYEISFRGFYPAQVSEEGGITVPAVSFFSILKEFPPGTITLSSTAAHALEMRQGMLDYKFVGLGPDAFPPVPSCAPESLYPCDGTVLKGMLEKTIFSVSLDELQPHLVGIFMEKLPEEGRLRCVSSDGHRLTCVDRDFEASQHLPMDPGVIIPRKGVVEMLRLLEGKECELGLEGKDLILRQGQEYLFIRLLDRKFPDYHRILPEQGSLRFNVPRQPFLEILRRMSLLSSEKFKGVIITINEDWLECRYHNPDIGGGEERLPITPDLLPAGEETEDVTLPLAVTYNARYLVEPIAVMGGEEVLLELVDKRKPLSLRDPTDRDFLAIVMPMDL